MFNAILRFFSSIAIRNIFTFVVILLLVVGPLAYFYLQDTEGLQTDRLSANVAVASKFGASLINASEVALITNPNYQYSREHNTLLALLKKIKTDFEVDNAVVYRRLPNKEFVYIAIDNEAFGINENMADSLHKRFPETKAAAIGAWETGQPQGTRLFKAGDSQFFQSNRPILLDGKVVAVLMLNDDATIVAREIELRQRLIAGGVAIALLLGIVVFFLISYITLRPLGRLRRGAQEVSAGNLDFDIPAQKGRSEIAELNQSFRGMVSDLRKSREEIEEYNRTLEQRIDERTREIRGLLDNMDEGIFTILSNGELMPGFSKATEEMLGAIGEGGNFFDAVHLSAKEKKTIEDTFQLLANPNLMVDWDDMVQFVPSEFETGDGQWLKARYRPIFDAEGNRTEAIMVVLQDVTTETALQADIQKSQAEQEMIVKILQNRENFELFYVDALEMMEDAGKLLNAMESYHRGSVDSLFRTMHTIKGTAALFGLARMSEMAHEIEDTLRDLRDNRDAAFSEEERHGVLLEIDKMRENMVGARREIIALTGEEDTGQRSITLSIGKVEQIAEQVLAKVPAGQKDEVSQILGRLKHVALSRLAKKYVTLVSQLASKLGKNAEFKLDGNSGEIELAPDFFGRLDASFLHIIRNSMDHALEHPEERIESGKQPVGQITLSAEFENGGIRFAISDDGKGIDTDRVLQIGLERGFVTEAQASDFTKDEIINLLFIPGFSSAQEVTELSGRGVGLDVVKTDVARLDGKLEIESILGKGTTFQLHFPASSMTMEPAAPQQMSIIESTEDAGSIISWLVENKAPVRLEIETSTHRFFSVLKEHPDGVEISCPIQHRKLLKPGDILRARLPDLANRELRMKIVSVEEPGAAENTGDGEGPERFSLIAGYREAVILDDRRVDHRVNTAQYKDLFFQAGDTGVTYRVLDLGLGGMKLYLPPGEKKFPFDVGAELPTGKIRMGKNLVVNLRTTVPRHIAPGSVGLQFEVDPTGKSLKLLEAFLNHVQEEDLMQA
ncbi:MAG: Hpt domain-containing protein [SAR324 cluster bacterium]|nr:Hpt domain-containing protein [SAR324 cluster bacterium]